jgi:predicted DNA-binding transcriptional regulator YafY
MAKKKSKSESTDAERRARQCERLARVLRALQCIIGAGRWDAEGLANELGVSVRTVHRILTTLTMAGVPVRYDAALKSYSVPRGYKFPGLDSKQGNAQVPANPATLLPAAKRLMRDTERLTESLKAFCEAFAETDNNGAPDVVA